MQSLVAARRQPAVAAARRGLGRLGAVRRASRGSGLGDGTGVLQDLADLDDLAEQLVPVLRRRADGRRRPRQAGPAARRRGRGRTPARCAELEQALRDTGYLKRGSDGQLRLSPKAMRQLGKALLRDVADRMSGRQGAARRPPRRRGGRALRGDPGVGSSATPSRGTSPAPSPTPCAARSPRAATPARGVRLDIDDVEVTETEARTQAARGAAGRHVVLDGDGRPLGADEAHRARAAHR